MKISQYIFKLEQIWYKVHSFNGVCNISLGRHFVESFPRARALMSQQCPKTIWFVFIKNFNHFQSCNLRGKHKQTERGGETNNSTHVFDTQEKMNEAIENKM